MTKAITLAINAIIHAENNKAHKSPEQILETAIAYVEHLFEKNPACAKRLHDENYKIATETAHPYTLARRLDAIAGTLYQIRADRTLHQDNWETYCFIHQVHTAKESLESPVLTAAKPDHRQNQTTRLQLALQT